MGNPVRDSNVTYDGDTFSFENYPNAHFIELSSPEAKRLGEFILHIHDLERVVAAMNYLAAHLGQPNHLRKTDALHQLIWSGAVITYCRCFDGSRPHALKAEELFVGGSLTAHQLIWNLRAKHYAHDVNDHRTVSVGAALGPDGDLLDVVWIGAEAIHWRQRHNDMQALSKIALEFAKWERQRIVDELAGVVSQVPISLRLAYPKMKQAKVGQLNVRASRRQSR